MRASNDEKTQIDVVFIQTIFDNQDNQIESNEVSNKRYYREDPDSLCVCNISTQRGEDVQPQHLEDDGVIDGSLGISQDGLEWLCKNRKEGQNAERCTCQNGEGKGQDVQLECTFSLV